MPLLLTLLLSCTGTSGQPSDSGAGLACPTPVLWYPDLDGDSFGAGDPVGPLCERPEGHVANDDDCDDGDPQVSPFADELCDGIDNDCDGLVDPDTALDTVTCYEDSDRDGYGQPDSARAACACTDGLADNDDDCDDGDPTVNPAATEQVFDDVDQDCDGDDDEYDADGDGYNWDGVEGGTDCDDGNATVNPGALDICGDKVDADCDGVLEECTLSGDLDADDDAWLKIHRTRGEDPYGVFGHDLAYAGDSNGDGLPEIVGLVVETHAKKPVAIPYVLVEIPAGTSGGDRTLDEQTIATWPVPTQGEYWTGMHAKSDMSIIAGHDLDGDGYGDFLFGTSSTDPVDAPGRLDLSYGPALGEQDLDAGPTLHYPSDLVEMRSAIEFLQPPDDEGRWSLAAHLFPVDADGLGTVHPGTVIVSSTDFDGSTDLADAPVLWTESPLEVSEKLEAGDLDGDGVADLVIASLNYTNSEPPGQVWVFSGPIEDDGIVNDAAVTIQGVNRDVSFGFVFAIVQDTDDGDPRLAIEAPDTADRADAQLGFYTPGSLDTPHSLGVDDADSRLLATDTLDFSPYMPRDVGDVDGDGRRELAVTANTKTANSTAHNALLLFEPPTAGTVILDDYETAIIDNTDVGPGTGRAILGNVDYDGDGLLDLVVGEHCWHDGAPPEDYYAPVGRFLIFRGDGVAR